MLPCTDQSRGSAVAWWLLPRTPDPEVGGSSPTRVNPRCVLEQCTFTPQKVLVLPRKRWLCPNITEKLFTGTLRINTPTNRPIIRPRLCSQLTTCTIHINIGRSIFQSCTRYCSITLESDTIGSQEYLWSEYKIFYSMVV